MPAQPVKFSNFQKCLKSIIINFDRHLVSSEPLPLTLEYLANDETDEEQHEDAKNDVLDSLEEGRKFESEKQNKIFQPNLERDDDSALSRGGHSSGGGRVVVMVPGGRVPAVVPSVGVREGVVVVGRPGVVGGGGGGPLSGIVRGPGIVHSGGGGGIVVEGPSIVVDLCTTSVIRSPVVVIVIGLQGDRDRSNMISIFCT